MKNNNVEVVIGSITWYNPMLKTIFIRSKYNPISFKQIICDINFVVCHKFDNIVTLDSDLYNIMD